MRIVFETRGLCPVLGWGDGVGGRVWAKKKGSYSVHTGGVNECLKWRVSGSILFFFFFLSFFHSIFRCWGCTLWWNLCTLHLLACQMNHRWRFRSLLRSFNAFWALIIYLCWFVAESCWAAEQIHLFGCFMFFVCFCFCFVFESRGWWQVKEYLITQFSLIKQKSLLFLTYLNTSFLVQNRRFRSHLV